jgi:chromosome segregation ATPase
VLYLAEVQKQKSGFMGSGKAEFKLIACQRSEQSWSAYDETIAAPDDIPYNAGAIVMVELTGAKQVRRHSEAGRQLVSILQNFSKLHEKSKTQEEEIEQWKQSLTYQSQELNRREMEMEARQEQLQQMEEDFERLEQQRQEIEAAQQEADRLREEFERKSQELEGAWAHLNGEVRRFEERQSELQQSATLDDDKAAALRSLIEQISGAVAPTESVREQLHQAFERLDEQQQLLQGHWQGLDDSRTTAQQQQSELEQQMQQVRDRWQAWHAAQDALDDLKAELRSQQQTLHLKQEYAGVLERQIKSQADLHRTVCLLADGSDAVTIGVSIDLSALEAMPLDELQRLTQELEQELEKNSKFVNSQEEELQYKQEDIDALCQKIEEANEFDRLQLENDLKDEQDGYEMLNETLVGQRRNLREREAILKQHKSVLARRQGHAVGEGDEGGIDLKPVLNQIEALRQAMQDELGQLQGTIHDLQATVNQLQGQLDHQTQQLQSQRDEVLEFEAQVNEQRAGVAELWGKVALYEALLQPVQDGYDHLRQRVQAIGDLMAQFQEASDYQLQGITELQQTIDQLTSHSPELAAS